MNLTPLSLVCWNILNHIFNYSLVVVVAEAGVYSTAHRSTAKLSNTASNAVPARVGNKGNKEATTDTLNGLFGSYWSAGLSHKAAKYHLKLQFKTSKNNNSPDLFSLATQVHIHSLIWPLVINNGKKSQGNITFVTLK